MTSLRTPCRSDEEREALRDLWRVVEAAESELDRLSRRLDRCGSRQAEVRRRLIA